MLPVLTSTVRHEGRRGFDLRKRFGEIRPCSAPRSLWDWIASPNASDLLGLLRRIVDLIGFFTVKLAIDLKIYVRVGVKEWGNYFG